MIFPTAYQPTVYQPTVYQPEQPKKSKSADREPDNTDSRDNFPQKNTGPI
jgi:hypothetical protein